MFQLVPLSAGASVQSWLKMLRSSLLYGTLKEKSVSPNIIAWLYSTSGIPQGTSEFLCDLILCEFHKFLNYSNICRIIGKNENRKQFTCKAVFKRPASLKSLNKFRQNWVNFFIQKLQSISIFSLEVDSPYWKLFSPCITSVWSFLKKCLNILYDTVFTSMIWTNNSRDSF